MSVELTYYLSLDYPASQLYTVQLSLNCVFLNSSSNGPEFVFIKLELQKGRYITIGNVYRSPKSTHTDDLQLCSELEHLAAEAKKDVIMLGDFNFPEIDWDLRHSVNNSYGSTVFFNTIHKLLLLQHVSFPTHARGTDTPHLLDLVITDCLLYTSPSPRDRTRSRMPSSA